MTQPVVILTYDPTTTIVGNGNPAQVASRLENDYSWRLITQNAPNAVLTGIFPNPENPNTIKPSNNAYFWPYRGGLNVGATRLEVRPQRGPIGFTVTGITLVGPNLNQQVLGNRNTLWTVNGVTAGVTGLDAYSGMPGPDNKYHYLASKFITNNAWKNISGFNNGYVHPDGHSKIIGWSIDGYPIYGPYGYLNPNNAASDVGLMISGYQVVIKNNRPANPEVVTYGSVLKSSAIKVKNPQVVAPGLRLTGGSLPGEVKVIGVDKDFVYLDTSVTVASNVKLQGTWPPGIFIEDYEYNATIGSLDRYNGRFCVTPEFPNGTYAYFATQTVDGDPAYPYFIGNNLYGTIQITPPPPAPPLAWVTPGGDLGTLTQGVFFQVQLVADAPNTEVFYQIIAGDIPPGMQVTNSGFVSGVPTLDNTQRYGQDFSSKFTVRAYTLNPNGTVNQFRDNTFTISIAGSRIPDFITPAGQIANYYDGTIITPIQLTFTGPLLDCFTRIVGGSLPVGLELSPTGTISGYVGLQPIFVDPPGYDASPEDIYGYDYLAPSDSYNYQFTVELTDGRQSNLRTFEIFVTSRTDLTADTTIITTDITTITADQGNDRVPFISNPEGFIGTIIDDNWFAYKFNGIDLDGEVVQYFIYQESGVKDGIEYNWSIPPGLTLDPLTGWLYGYVPSQGISRQTYTLALKVGNVNKPAVLSKFYFYTITIISGIDTTTLWLTDSNLGTIDNGAASLFYVEAQSIAGADISYRLKQGSKSKLPQGLTLLPSGRIAGNVSFNTFALDNGTTTFDVSPRNRLQTTPTTFDLVYRFTVNAYSPTVQQLIYKVNAINIQNGGSGFTSTPTVTISPPDQDGRPATVGSVSLTFFPGKGLVISSVTIADPGYGYRVPPTVTVTGGGGTGANLTAELALVETDFLISEDKEFLITINRTFNEPLDTLYIRAMPPAYSVEIIDNLIQNPEYLPINKLFRPDDSNFGVAKELYFVQAYGLPASTVEAYQAALAYNHYWKNVVLGPIKTARAVDPETGSILYEVIYSPVIDNLVNDLGQSVSKQVQLPFPITLSTGEVISEVYPNSLDDMRQQIVDSVGSIENILPLWMTSFQENGQQLGFIPAWVIAYVLPGTSKQLAFTINEVFGTQLNKIDFEIDRYELGRALSHNWDPIADSTGGRWVPTPASTTFDLDKHYWPATSDGSTEIFIGGLGYAVGDKLRVLGSVFGGDDGVNDLIITVTHTDELGTIQNYRFEGLAPALAIPGTIFTNITGPVINRTTAATGALFDVDISPRGATTFDLNSLSFVSPSDMYGVGDRYNKYLVFPKRNILE